MIIKRKIFTEKLPDSRIGIGWIQDKNDKVKSEKYLRKAKDAADKSFEKYKDPDKAIKASKNQVTKEVLKEELPIPVGKAIGYGAIGYGVSKSPELINKILDSDINLRNLPRIPSGLSNKLKKNSGKVASAVALGTLLYNSPKIKKKIDSAREGARINTETRLKSLKNKK